MVGVSETFRGLRGFQKNNPPVSTLAKVILSLSKDDFCGFGTGKTRSESPFD
jgi:hypothetical protein